MSLILCFFFQSHQIKIFLCNSIFFDLLSYARGTSKHLHFFSSYCDVLQWDKASGENPETALSRYETQLKKLNEQAQV